MEKSDHDMADVGESQASNANAASFKDDTPESKDNMEKQQLEYREGSTKTPIKTEEKVELRNGTVTPQLPVSETSITSDRKVNLPDSMAVHEVVGGSSIRRWLNENVTPSLQECLRRVANEKPEDPLRFLGELLIQKSDESKQKKASE